MYANFFLTCHLSVHSFKNKKENFYLNLLLLILSASETFTPLFQDSVDQTSSMKQKEKDIPWSSGEVQQIDSDTRKSCNGQGVNGSLAESVNRMSGSSMEESTTTSFLVESNRTTALTRLDSQNIDDETRKDDSIASSSGSPWYQLRKDATAFVSQTLQRGRKNLWQLTTSRVSVLLSSTAVCSTSIHQFLKNYEDLNVFILAGEAFCGVEAVEFRQKLKGVCENYFAAFHRQNIYVSLFYWLLLSTLFSIIVLDVLFGTACYAH